MTFLTGVQSVRFKRTAKIQGLDIKGSVHHNSRETRHTSNALMHALRQYFASTVLLVVHLHRYKLSLGTDDRFKKIFGIDGLTLGYVQQPI